MRTSTMFVVVVRLGGSGRESLVMNLSMQSWPTDAERGDGRALPATLALWLHCSTLYVFNKLENRRSEKLRFFRQHQILVTKCSRVVFPLIIFSGSVSSPSVFTVGRFPTGGIRARVRGTSPSPWRLRRGPAAIHQLGRLTTRSTLALAVPAQRLRRSPPPQVAHHRADRARATHDARAPGMHVVHGRG